ncbi:uncharacterized protein LOC132275265 [Cornus florida]|uniref:uncharacterized protein LOC132275265 n=1 Tax=Cornus florida TaxID=4283 RepID=UPI0028980964|nr:uncharacterized protein LOC132275265 [Cornus florida]XP_059632708.1 uncharacterized protein LOC132275265 [Cornus florida]
MFLLPVFLTQGISKIYSKIGLERTQRSKSRVEFNGESKKNGELEKDAKEMKNVVEIKVESKKNRKLGVKETKNVVPSVVDLEEKKRELKRLEVELEKKKRELEMLEKSKNVVQVVVDDDDGDGDAVEENSQGDDVCVDLEDSKESESSSEDDRYWRKRVDIWKKKNLVQSGVDLEEKKS